jgi:hypothetical protein
LGNFPVDIVVDLFDGGIEEIDERNDVIIGGWQVLLHGLKLIIEGIFGVLGFSGEFKQ